MSLVILQPCGSPSAREHYNDTIANPVPIERVSQFVTPADQIELSKIYPG